MTFWNSAYCHYFGCGNLLYIFNKKLDRANRNAILAVNKTIRYGRKRKPVYTCTPATATQIRKSLGIKNWKNYYVNVKVKYG